jgi:hypothetical protein
MKQQSLLRYRGLAKNHHGCALTSLLSTCKRIANACQCSGRTAPQGWETGLERA